MLLYSLGISAYNLAIFISRFFNKKAELLYNGRQNSFKILHAFKRNQNQKLAWFHCASLGEFEQARPVIEKLKTTQNYQIALSFFSPSGYEIRKNYALADVVFYLPSDSKSNAQKVIQLLQPTCMLFVKYEIWIHYINQLATELIPHYLISATFRENQIYFKWYGARFKKALLSFTMIFTQDSESLKILKKNAINNIILSNDTRYDRVFETSLQAKELPIIKAFKSDKKLLVLGSSYSQEEELTNTLLNENIDIKVIIAPHQISESRITGIEKIFKSFKTIRYSQIANQTEFQDSQILIIDNIGLLSSIYQYADISFIGGGFGKSGIHNTLEASTFGIPIIIGPNNHNKFPEVCLLKQRQILFSISNYTEFLNIITKLYNDEKQLKQIKENAKTFIKENLGATDLIIKYLN